MSCNCNKPIQSGNDFNVKTVGICDVSKLTIDGSDISNLNWTEISVPEILCIPKQKPDIEQINQVYANVTLDCVRLIETPFAYKSYILYSFYTSVRNLSSRLPRLISALDKQVSAIITPHLDTNIPNAIDDLIKKLQELITVPGVMELIESLEKYEIKIEKLVSDIKSAISAVDRAVKNLIEAIAIKPLSPEMICKAIKALEDSLNTLSVLLLSIIPKLNKMVREITDQAESIKNEDVTATVKEFSSTVNKFIEALSSLITSATASIKIMISLLSKVDCEKIYVFSLIGNKEGTCLSGRKLVIEGTIHQKVVYTAEVAAQSVHSAHYEMPFVAFIIAYPKFEDLTYSEDLEVYDPITNGPITVSGYIYDINEGIVVDLCEEFDVTDCIEDIYIYALSKRKIFKNVTIFLKAKPSKKCK